MPKAKPAGATCLLVLDTHVWIWVLEGAKVQLSSATVNLVEEAAGRAEVAVAAISVWEVAMLAAKRRITLSHSIDEWAAAALAAPGIRLVELTPQIALESTRLPGAAHGDPADRLIIATARVLGATLATCDDRILEYASHGHVRARNGRSRS